MQIDPDYAHAMTMLAFTHFIAARFGFSNSRADSFKRTVELAKKAITLNEKDPLIHALWEYIYLYQGEHDKAVEEGRESIALGPSNAEVHILFGQVLMYSGMFEESVEMCEKAIRLHPHPPLYYLNILMGAYGWVKRYDKVLTIGEKLIESGLRTRKALAYSSLAAIHIVLGNENIAREYVAKLLEIYPKYNLDYVRKAQYYRDPNHLEIVLDLLRRAGVPEHPPSQ